MAFARVCTACVRTVRQATAHSQPRPTLPTPRAFSALAPTTPAYAKKAKKAETLPAEDEEFVEDEFEDELDGSVGEEPGEAGKATKDTKESKYGEAQRQLRRALRLKGRNLRASPPSTRILENLANNAEPHQFTQVQDAIRKWHERNFLKPNSRLPEVVASRFGRGGAAVKAVDMLANRNIYRMDAPSLLNLYPVFRGLSRAQPNASETPAPAGFDSAASPTEIVDAAFTLHTLTLVYHPEANNNPLIDAFVLATALKNGETDSPRVQAMIKRLAVRHEGPIVAYAEHKLPHKWVAVLVTQMRDIAVALVERKDANAEFFAHLAERLMAETAGGKAKAQA
ncbi:hypothetical protein NBRC10512_000605 [Rhodotorula toruloides]|uniref:RHTO0S01e06062g1_1 n=2 Tax=Rhodotorula toruloides TaxID=5286 RepID=A0A061ADX3_RHOTO|nr:uncharacterized protein RHTO_01419 [Rhodotorula toruloides NP11]EMS21772.1 hypothetical protein RHTO_01419 [Rhodotorula toruloides NP11]CDR35740.1 RHTO0S01e06062g1_1 [Rhodotorula toruloides]